VKAVVYHRYGGPEVLELTELPEPKTHVDSVLIRVKAAGLNRADAAIQAGALDSAVETFFPVVPGWDVAGVVERSGPGAREFAAGDEVIAYVRGDVNRAHGGFAELVSADVRNVAHKPRTMSFAEAAGLPLAALTAYQGVVHARAVQPGETLLVLGAAGGVGSVAAQIALARGARVIGAASPDDADYLTCVRSAPSLSCAARGWSSRC
jgi:NADPH:quinone reductase-like Zn-dependent oxidoreductase